MTTLPLITDELDVLDTLVPLPGAHIVEAGCGAAHLARGLLKRHPAAHVTGLDVDDIQLAKNRAAPAERLDFVRAGAQHLPFDDACFDGALMLKSLHHVPLDQMDRALDELARVLRPGGWLYVSEPVFDGPLNELIRVFNDEQAVRAAAQQALDRALAGGRWRPAAERHFAVPVQFTDFADFERRLMHPSFADHHIDDTVRARVQALYQPHQRADGAFFSRPMHVRLLRTQG